MERARLCGAIRPKINYEEKKQATMEWSQTETTVTVSFPLAGVQKKNVDCDYEFDKYVPRALAYQR